MAGRFPKRVFYSSALPSRKCPVDRPISQTDRDDIREASRLSLEIDTKRSKAPTGRQHYHKLDDYGRIFISHRYFSTVCLR